MKLDRYVNRLDKDGNREVIIEIIGEKMRLNIIIIKLNIPFIIAFIIAYPP